MPTAPWTSAVQLRRCFSHELASSVLHGTMIGASAANLVRDARSNIFGVRMAAKRAVVLETQNQANPAMAIQNVADGHGIGGNTVRTFRPCVALILND